ncbi:hypothetical protein Poly41_51790 [Novipirellula artificiosorum]|uniref:Uncharacterized protein n=1 Tax=Novipirellula artificiosorum TaxID=2528016 RepID=A0A5C6D799_9BACT|nr:hypothetical protein Poly41_51790 [Novipirellula artificiosorum]
MRIGPVAATKRKFLNILKPFVGTVYDINQAVFR